MRQEMVSIWTRTIPWESLTAINSPWYVVVGSSELTANFISAAKNIIFWTFPVRNNFLSGQNFFQNFSQFNFDYRAISATLVNNPMIIGMGWGLKTWQFKATHPRWKKKVSGPSVHSSRIRNKPYLGFIPRGIY